MIEPIVCEQEWICQISDLPQWQPPFLRTVIVAPHPDDETLATGGLIAQLVSAGVEVHVVAVTDGEAAYKNANLDALGARRRREQVAALAELGLDSGSLHRLHLPDSSVASQEAYLSERLCALIDSHTHLIAPWRRDVHPDHEACGRAAFLAAGHQKALFTEWLFWAWHRQPQEVLHGLPFRQLPLDQPSWRSKQQAIECHVSQLSSEYGDPILPGNLLEPARRPFEVYLPSW